MSSTQTAGVNDVAITFGGCIRSACMSNVCIAAGVDDVVPMEALGGAYRRLATHDRLGSAVQASAK